MIKSGLPESWCGIDYSQQTQTRVTFGLFTPYEKNLPTALSSIWILLMTLDNQN